MTKLLEEETKDKQNPTILIYGNKSPLINPLIEIYSKNLKVIIVSENEKNFVNLKSNENVKFINVKSIESLNHNLDYSVLFIEKVEDKKYLFSLLEVIDKNKTKTELIFNVSDLANFFDVILDLKKKENFYFFALGDLFGKNINKEDSFISSVLSDVKDKNLVTVNANELFPIFPISLSDATNAINQIIFGKSKNDAIYYLFYNYPQTYISAVHLLKRVKHNLEIRFEGKKNQQCLRSRLDQIEREVASKLKLEGIYLDSEFLGFEKSIKAFLENTPNEIPKENKPTQKKTQKKSLPFLFIYILTIFFFYILFVTGLSWGMSFCFNQSLNYFKNEKFIQAQMSAQNVNRISFVLDPTINLTQNVLTNKKFINSFYRDYELYKRDAKIIETAADLINKITNKDEIKESQDFNYIYFEIERLKIENPNEGKLLEEIILSKINNL